MIVVGYRRVALEKIVKFHLNVENMALFVVAEKLLEARLDSTSNGVGLHDDLEEFKGDKPVEPGENNVVHPFPISLGRLINARSDMLDEAILTESPRRVLAI